MFKARILLGGLWVLFLILFPAHARASVSGGEHDAMNLLPPTAVLSVDTPTPHLVDNTISFDGTDSADADAVGPTAVTCAWSVDGQAQSTSCTFNWSTPTVGSYTIALVVTDNEGQTASANTTVSVTNPNMEIQPLTHATVVVDDGQQGAASIDVTNHNDVAVTVSATANAGWMTLASQSLVVAARTTETFSLTLDSDAAAPHDMQPGSTYTGSVAFSWGDEGGGTVTVPFQVDHPPAPLLSGTCTNCSSGNVIVGFTDSGTISLSNNGDADAVNITVTKSAQADWLTINSTPSTIATGQNGTVTFTVQANSMGTPAPAQVQVAYDGGPTQYFTVTVTGVAASVVVTDVTQSMSVPQGEQGSVSIPITNNENQTITVTASSTVDWLVIEDADIAPNSTTGSALGTIYTVRSSPSVNLVNGDAPTGQINLSWPGGSTSVTVNLSVGPPLAPNVSLSTVTPDPATFNLFPGGQGSGTIRVLNTGTADANNLTVTDPGEPWLELGAASISVPHTGTNWVDISFSVNVDSLSVADHGTDTATIGIADGMGGTLSVPVTVTLVEPANLSASDPAVVEVLAGEDATVTVVLSNTGDVALDYQAAGSLWASIQDTGTIANKSNTTIHVPLLVSGLTLGQHTTNLTVTWNGAGGSGTATITVTVDVQAASIVVTDAAQSVSVPQGEEGAISIPITNNDTQTITVTASSTVPWMAVADTDFAPSGSPTQLPVTIYTVRSSPSVNLVNGDAPTGQINLSWPGGSTSVTVNLSVGPPLAPNVSLSTVTPDPATFNLFPGGQGSGTIRVLNTGTADANNLTVTDPGEPWLELGAASISVPHTGTNWVDISFSVNVDSLSVADHGTDTATIGIADGMGGTLSVPVTVTLVEPANLSASDPAVVEVLAGEDATVTVVLSNTGDVALNYDITASSKPWASVGATGTVAGKGNTTVNVPLAVNGLAVGGDSADLTIAWNGAGGSGTATVTVTVDVQAGQIVVANTAQAVSVPQGEQSSISIPITNNDSQTITVTASSTVPWMAVADTDFAPLGSPTQLPVTIYTVRSSPSVNLVNGDTPTGQINLSWPGGSTSVTVNLTVTSPPAPQLAGTLNPNPANFALLPGGQDSGTITLTNTGTADAGSLTVTTNPAVSWLSVEETLVSVPYTPGQNQATITYNITTNGVNIEQQVSAAIVVDDGNGGTLSFAVQLEVLKPAPGIPTLLSPADGATSIDSASPPTLSWSAVTHATSYDVQLADNVAFTNPLLDINAGNTSELAPALDAGRTYWWRVRARNSSGESDWSQAFSFSTAMPTASTLTPTGDISVTTSVVPLAWSLPAVTGIQALTVDVAAGSACTFTPPLADQQSLGVSATTANVSGLTWGATYCWQLRLQYANGTVTALGGRFVYAPVPDVPSGPTTSALSASGVTLGWETAQFAQLYDIEVHRNSTYTDLAQSATDVNALNTPIAGLDAGRQYWWRVRGTNTSGSGAWGMGAAFTFTTLAPAATNLVPNATTGPAPLLQWDLPSVSGVDSVAVQLETGTACTFSGALVMNATGLAATTEAHQAPSLSFGQSYCWRVVLHYPDAQAMADTTFTVRPLPGAISGFQVSAFDSTAATLTWNAATEADHYAVQLDTTSSFANAFGPTEHPATSYPAAGLAAGQQYWARAQARNSSGAGAWTSNVIFTTQAPAARALSPGGDATVATTTVPLAWTLPTVPGIEQVRVEVEAGTACLFSGSLAYQNTLAATATALSLGSGDLTAGTSYCWRVVLNYADAVATAPGERFTYQPVVQTPQLTIVDDLNTAPGLCAGAEPIDYLTLRNDGTANLTWSVNSQPPWLNVQYDGLATTLLPDSSTTLTLTFYENAIDWGATPNPSTTLSLTSNDPGSPHSWLLEPVQAQGTLQVTPLSADTSLALGQTVSYDLQIQAHTCAVESLSVTRDRSWVTLSAAPTTLAAGGSTTVTASLVADSLGIGGDDTATLTIHGGAGAAPQRTVRLTVDIPMPTLLTPADADTTASIQPVLAWQGLPGASAYTVQLSDTIAFTTTVLDSLVAHQPTAQSLAVPEGVLQAEQTYYWRVRAHAQGAVGAFSAPAWSFVTGTLPPGALLVTPLADEGYAPTLTAFAWQAVGAATAYQLEVTTAADSAFATPLMSRLYDDTQGAPATHDTLTVLDALAHDTAYRWRIRTTTAAGISAPALGQVFRTRYAAPTGLSPSDSLFSVRQTQPLCWSNTPATARPGLSLTSYEVRLRSSSQDTTYTVAADSSGITCWSGHALGWVLGERYHWAVRARDNAPMQDAVQGKGAWSDEHTFTVTPFAFLSPVAGDQWLPDSSYTVRWNSAAPQGTLVDLIVLDANGGDTILANDTLDTGTYDWTLPASLTTGLYTLQLVRSDSTVHEATSAAFHVASDGQIFALDPALTSYDFGAVVAGYVQEQRFTLSNPGSEALVGAITLSNDPDFTLRVEELALQNGSGQNLRSFNYEVEPGGALQVAVAFQPLVGDSLSRTASLTLTHNDAEQASPFHTVSFGGQALAFDGGPRLVMSPAVDTLVYGAVAQGYRLPKRLTLSNTGTESVSGVVELVGEEVGDENQWQLEQGGSVVADGTSLDLAPGESTTLDVVMTPQAIGETAATFRYVHNDSQYPGGSPLEVALFGEGVATQDSRHFVLEPEYGGLSFGSSNAGDTTIQVVTVSNAATASEALSVWLDLSDQVNYAVQVDGVEISYGSLIYGGTPGAALLTLSPGESKQVEILYKPQTPGEHVSSVHIRHDDSDYQPSEVLMTVWGVGLDGARKRYYYLSDHLSSVRATVNETGEVVHYDDYYPFGLQMPGRSYAGGDEAPKERYTGHELDEETDLYYAGFRYLDPVIARWLAVDPLAEHPNQIDKSPYQYAWNNPIKWNDPDGRCPMCVVGLYLLFEAALTAYDVYDVTTTLADANASTAAKSASVTGALAGFFLPGGGYSGVDNVVEAGANLIRGADGVRGLKAGGSLADLTRAEKSVASQLNKRGDSVIGLGDDGVRETLGIASDVKAADFLSVTEGGRFNITEVKAAFGKGGADIDGGIKQIKNTLDALQNKVSGAKIGRVEIALPKGANLRGGYSVSGNRLVRVTDEGTEVVRVGGKAVHVSYID